MDPIVTNTFEKQPREIRSFPVNWSGFLSDNALIPRAVNPIEFDPVVPADAVAGLVIDEHDFNPATGLLWIKFSGGVHGRKYLVTIWLHTDDGQKKEHEITVKVKEKTK